MLNDDNQLKWITKKPLNINTEERLPVDLDVLQGRSDGRGSGSAVLFRNRRHRLFINIRYGVTLQLSFKGRLNGIQRRVQTPVNSASDRTRGVRVLMKVKSGALLPVSTAR